MFTPFEHTADVGLFVQAANVNALFAEAGRGLLSILVDDPQEVRPERELTIEVPGTQLDYLLFDWLSELLFRFESERLLLAEFDVSIGENGLSAKARGEVFEEGRHHLAHEVKAVTYHQLEVKQTPDGWQARFILDI